jgi:hypothetical protein
MRRLALFLAVGLLAFLLGVTCARGYACLLGLLPVADESLVPVPDNVLGFEPAQAGRVTDGLRVTFLRTEQHKFGCYAEFLITNERPDSVRYIHFGDLVGEAHEIRQNGVISPIVRGCAYGSTSATLKPGESARFTARIADRDAPFEVGFRIMAGEDKPDDRKGKTVWSEKVSPRAR